MLMDKMGDIAKIMTMEQVKQCWGFKCLLQPSEMVNPSVLQTNAFVFL